MLIPHQGIIFAEHNTPLRYMTRKTGFVSCYSQVRKIAMQFEMNPSHKEENKHKLPGKTDITETFQ